MVGASPVFETKWVNERRCSVLINEERKPRAKGATLDTACRRGVLGREWLRNWERERASFVRRNKEIIRRHPVLRDWAAQKTRWGTSKSLFRFGDGRVVKALGNVWISALLHDGPAWLQYDVVLGWLCALMSRPTMTNMLYVIELPENTVLQLAHRKGPVAFRVKCDESEDRHLELPMLPPELTEETLVRMFPGPAPALTREPALKDGVAV